MCDSIDEVCLQVSLRLIRNHIDTLQENIFHYTLSVQVAFFFFLHFLLSVTVDCLILVCALRGAAHWERCGADPSSAVFIALCLLMLTLGFEL